MCSTRDECQAQYDPASIPHIMQATMQVHLEVSQTDLLLHQQTRPVVLRMCQEWG